jgi:hypothetical protein
MLEQDDFVVAFRQRPYTEFTGVWSAPVEFNHTGGFIVGAIEAAGVDDVRVSQG